MNWPSVLLGFTAAVGAAMSCGGGERERWLPGPSTLHFGAIDDGYLLSYQWQPSDAPLRSRTPHPSTARWRVPAEHWLVAVEWKPVDVQWYLCDLDQGRVTPLKEVMPREAKALSIHRNAAAPHHAPHRWRWAGGRLWIAKFDISGSFFPGAYACLMRMLLDPRHPATSQMELRGYSGMRVIDELLDHGMPWWDEWRPADGYRRNRMDYDCVPLSDYEAVLAALVENGMSVWKGDRRRATAGGQPRPPRNDFRPIADEWRRVATFAAPFIEPFHLALVDGAYFFVTDESGEVHLAREQDGQWKTVPLWNDPARPVVAMLTNSGNSTTYVFGKDFYFQLAAKIEVKPCKDITKGHRDLTDPMRTVVECAQVLQEANLLGD